jgi:Na+/H+ antiporter NhaA
VALLMTDRAFPHGEFAAVAKIGVLVGSILAALLGSLVLITNGQTMTPCEQEAHAGSTDPNRPA